MANLDGMHLLNAERDLVVALQQAINDCGLTDMEVVELLHRLLGVGISRISGGCSETN